MKENIDQVKQQKKDLRLQIRSDLKGITNREQRNERITQKLLEAVKGASQVLAFVSMGGEPDTYALLEHLFKQGTSVAVPRCTQNGDMDFYYLWSVDELIYSSYGILEPSSTATPYRPVEGEICIVPGMAFSKDGKRMGRGGGYYDKFLGAFPRKTVGVCYKEFLFDDLPTLPHDQRVGAVITDE